MAKEFYSKLEKLLKKDSRFVDQEKDLLKSNVIDAAYKADKKLVEMLLSEKEFKSKFFSKIKDALIFDINNFVAYIQDKNFLADSYTKYRNKIGLNIDGKFLNERKEVALVWPFKDCVLEGGMTKEDEKRKEIFFNEILAQDEIDKLLAPKVLTNWKRCTVGTGLKPVSTQDKTVFKRDVDGTIRENLIIKGNNLLTLHSLKQQFQNKVKLIYIDPPYNTGNDSFGYNDNFNHSTWLTFMKNRLEVARELLRDDGVIFISCDDNEQAYLKVLCDEVFERENKIGTFVWRKKAGAGSDSKRFFGQHEYIIFYSKEINKIPELYQTLTEKQKQEYKNPDNDSRGDWAGTDLTAPAHDNDPRRIYEIVSPAGKIFKRCWSYTKENMNKLLEDNLIYFGKNDNQIPKRKRFLKDKEGLVPRSWIDFVLTSGGKKDLDVLFKEKDNFQYPKPVSLIKHFIKIGSNKNDIIIDFFAGSGTTAQAVLELNKEDGGNRKFILVEQMDYVEKITVERIKKVIKKEKIKDDFVYCELMEYNERFVEKIKKAKDVKILLKIWEEMKEKSFLNYNVDIKKFDETIDKFKKFPLAKQQRTLFDLLNKNQLYVGLSEIEDVEFGIEEGDKKLNDEFYGAK